MQQHSTEFVGAILLGGSAGTLGQVPVSQGAGVPPAWGAGGVGGSQTPWTANVDADGFSLLVDDNTGIMSSEAGNPDLLLFVSVPSGTQRLRLTNSIAANPVLLDTNAPIVAGTSQAGTGVAFTASAATAGNVTNGAAPGGGFLFQSGAAARLNTGTERGGDFEFRRGASIGSATIGGGAIFPTLPRYDDNPICFRLNAGTLLRQYGMGLTDGGGTLSIAAPTILSLCVGDSAATFTFGQILFNAQTFLQACPGTSNPFDVAADVGFGRGAAKVWKFTDGTSPGIVGGTWSAPGTSPAQIVADTNNYNPGGSSYFQRWNTDASRQITGLTFTAPQVAGQRHEIWNVGGQDIVLVHNSGSSLAANRFLNSSGISYTLTPNQGASLTYDATTGSWRVCLLQ